MPVPYLHSLYCNSRKRTRFYADLPGVLRWQRDSKVIRKPIQSSTSIAVCLRAKTCHFLGCARLYFTGVRIGQIGSCGIGVTPLAGDGTTGKLRTLNCCVQLCVDRFEGIALPEQNALEHRPNLRISPMLAEDVGRVNSARNVVEGDETSCDGFSNSMK